VFAGKSEATGGAPGKFEARHIFRARDVHDPRRAFADKLDGGAR
jgi:hypothetical protein